MSDQGLLPCPFCGGDAEAYEAFPTMIDGWTWSADHSGDCVMRGLDTLCFETAADVAKAWNTRTPPTTGDKPDV